CPTQMRLEKLNWKEIVNLTSSCAAMKKWSQVEAGARQLLEMDSKNPWGHYFLSFVSVSQRNYTLAHWNLDNAIELAPKNALLKYQKGLVYWEESKEALAIKWIELAAKDDKSLAEAHLFLGQLYLRDYDYKLASQHFREVVRTRPSNKEAWNGLEICKKNGVSVEEQGKSESPRELAKASSESRGEK
ncbi:MAG: hypothetical protein KDD25_07105, partial [Bdellovibrionales bacterium]|nr:hypothetical protein [Bdellovibrionales bacterium]